MAEPVRAILSGMGRLIVAGSERLASNLGQDRDRWFLWLPVALGIGIGIYFSLPFEPPLLFGPAGFLVIAVLAYLLRRRSAPFVAAVALAAMALGFAAAQVRVALVEGPLLAKRIGPVVLAGRVVDLQLRTKGTRIVLDELKVPKLGSDATPRRVRIRLSGADKAPNVRPGDRITIRAVLLPLPAPAAPGTFDFQRYAFFKQIGATGYAIGPPKKQAPVAGDKTSGVAIWLRSIRQDVTVRIRAALPGTQGAIAAALLTGERGAIPEKTLTSIRDAGLAHLLAISGLHIGLVAGIMFFFIRGFLAAFPAIALRFPIKKWAAVCALCGAFVYLLLSGATIPTQRAFLMLTVVMLGVMLDRVGLSLRLVAWAAIVVVLVQPESLLSASFQLSFAAVIALVAVYEVLRNRTTIWRGSPGPAGRVGRYVGAVGLTTLVAGAATTPFAVYHFNRLAAYGLAANLMAVPTTAFWIMPLGLLGLIMMPFGLEAFPLQGMGLGIGFLIWIAGTVSSWPGAVALVPALPTEGLLLIVAGGLWLALWRRSWRLWGVPVLIVGLMTGAMTRPPDILITGSGKLLGARADDGRLLLSSARAGRFAGKVWLKRDGQVKRTYWPNHGVSADGRLRCDALGCIYKAGKQVIALVRKPLAFSDDCRKATMVVTVDFPGPACAAAGPVIHRANLSRDGSHAIWLPRPGLFGNAKLVIVTDRALRGNRPWVVPPPKWTRRYRLNADGNVLVRMARTGQRLYRRGYHRSRRNQNLRRSPIRRP